MDELYRIAAARRRTSICATRRSPAVPRGSNDHKESAAVAAKRKSVQEQANGGGGGGADIAEVLIRLTLLSRRPRGRFPGVISCGPSAADDEKSSVSLEADFGASVDDVVEIVQRAATTAASLRSSSSSSRNGNQSRGNTTGDTTINSQTAYAAVAHNPLTSFFPSIVGFSIDVGQACLDDAIAAEAEAAATAAAVAGTRPLGSVRDDVSSVRTAAQAAIRLPPGEEVASLTLSEGIDAAVAFVVEVARRATDSVTAACAALDMGAAAVDSEETTLKEGHLAPGGGCASRTPAPRFRLSRLHVTGLGNGGARGEPLAALKTALSRHLPTLSVAAATGGGGGLNGRGGGIDRLVVSADATEHLVAGGVWSTVTSIIGRKDVLSSNSTGQTPRPPPQPPCAGSGRDTDSDENRSRADGETAAAAAAAVEKMDTIGSKSAGGSGAMYYVDDGCYGSLSGAILRAEPIQPLPLVRSYHPSPTCGRAASSSSKLQPTGSKTDFHHHSHEQQQDAAKTPRTLAAPAAEPPRAAAGTSSVDAAPPPAPCTVWGPTCDGLDCVSRVTLLPAEMEPGRDWLFFPERGMRAGADVSGFNGLKPLDSFYCVRQSSEVPPSFSSSVW